MTNSIFGSFKPCVLALALLGLASCQPAPSETPPEALLYVWAYDEDKNGPSFLMVIDADPASPGYGTIVDTVATEGVGLDAHHTNHTLPPSGRLFANDFVGGRTHIFETSETPLKPVYAGTFGNRGEFYHPHTFVELPNANVLATFQYQDDEGNRTGGILELDPSGEVVRSVDATDPDIPELRPYSVEVLPELDRVVMVSADMMAKVNDHRVQIRKLSDLSLSSTLELPAPAREEARFAPLESRVLGDGKTLYVSTYMCGLYLLTGVDTDTPEVTFLKDWGNKGCAIPVVIGNYYLLALGENHAVAVLDVSDPANPIEVSRLEFPADFEPHWIGAKSDGTKIALTGYGEGLKTRILMLDFDPETGALSIDESFGAGDDRGSGLMVNLEDWPHGGKGPAIVHAAVFWEETK